MSNLNFGLKSKENLDQEMEPVTFRQSSFKIQEEEKLTPMPIVKTKSHNINEKSNADRFIP